VRVLFAISMTTAAACDPSAAVCNGQLNELIGPSGQVPINSFMIRRPFDFPR
jgi:hypothetical protein